MKILRFIVILLGAVILLLAGFSAGREAYRGVQEKQIMSGGRRVSRLVDQAREPSVFWLVVGMDGAMCLAFCGGGLFLAYLAFRGPRDKSAR